MESRTIERKEGRIWITSRTITDTAEIYTALAIDLTARYLHRAAYIRRIVDKSNYDGTRCITVFYDNNVRSIYTVKG